MLGRERTSEPGAATSQTTLPGALLTAMRYGILLVFLGTFAYYVKISWSWKLMANPPIMHYVVFLMHHGLKPYSQITDTNMPGAYIAQATAIRVFGGTDHGWRLFEFFLTGVMSGSMAWLARRWDWAAGVFAATMFLALHISEGAEFAGERDEIVAVLLVFSFAVFFHAMRHRRPALMVVPAIACGLASSIKPTFLVVPVGLALLLVWVTRRRAESPLRYLLWIAAGIVAVGAMVLLFLLREGAVHNFVVVLETQVPAYASISGAGSAWPLWRGALPRSFYYLVLLTLPLIFSNWKRGRRWSAEQWALLAGAAFGFLSYYVQGKGFVYHRYPMLMFLLLVLGIEIFAAARSRGWSQWLAAAVLVFSAGLLVPRYLHAGTILSGRSDFTASLEDDLQRLGGAAALQEKVQCFDLSYGCFNALYHLNIVQANGWMGDMMFYRQPVTPIVASSRSMYWDRIKDNPPAIYVISNQDFEVDHGFGKLARWPEFDSYLAQNYVEVAERHFAHERFAGQYVHALPLQDQDAYRIYIRKGSPLLQRAKSLDTSDSQLTP